MSDPFVNLHVHTDYSILDGASTVDQYVGLAVQLGQPALAITDHGNQWGSYTFYKACVAAGIKPILGIEAYYAPESRLNHTPVRWGIDGQTDDVSGRGAYTHITLLAESVTGLRNLHRLGYDSYAKGMYRKPRIDFESLAAHNEGVIALSGCAGSSLSKRVLLGQLPQAERLADDFRSVFGDRYFIEIMEHRTGFDSKLNPGLIGLADSLRIPLVATNDSHYAHKDLSKVHEAMLCVQTGTTLSSKDRFRFEGGGYHLASSRDMLSHGLDSEWIGNTLGIAERVGDYSEMFMARELLPRAEKELEYMVRWERYDSVYRERLAYELRVINETGFADYFVVLADIIRWAKLQGISVGPARGSGGGSLVCYDLGITGIDPIKYGLVFERFLNPERLSAPDIDVDFDDERRSEVIEYAVQKYGERRVAQVMTVGTMKGRSALLDSARVLDRTAEQGAAITAKYPPDVFGRSAELESVRRRIRPLDPEVYDLALGLEGMIRNAGSHASAFVISPIDMLEVMPLWINGSQLMTGWDGDQIAAAGFTKFDFLGLATLNLLGRILPESGYQELRQIPLDDRPTYSLLGTGHTLTVFQLDSPGMQKILRELKPSRLEDIAAVISLYRPGPLGTGSHIRYTKNKVAGRTLPEIHDDINAQLEPILSETYGLIVYQEQVLNVLKFMGYTYASADLIFNAMRKKDTDKMKAAFPQFEEKGVSIGWSKDGVKALWDTLVPFADYSFNKSHAIGYAHIAYWSAYFKANDPDRWMAAALSKEDKPEKLVDYLSEVRRLGIRILPPDVNYSSDRFAAGPEGIHYGISSIKGIGDSGYSAVLSARPYGSVDDYLMRVPREGLNRGSLKSLIMGGAFDGMTSREGFLEELDFLVDAASLRRDRARVHQGSLVKVALRPSQRATDTLERQHQELVTLGVSLTTEKWQLELKTPLDEREWIFLKKMFDTNPGDIPLTIRYGSWSHTVKVADTIKRAIQALGDKVELSLQLL